MALLNMAFSISPRSERFSLEGAVYIEYLVKRGHFINQEDTAEALRRTNRPCPTSSLGAHLARIDWLDTHHPIESEERLSRYAMDRISAGRAVPLVTMEKFMKWRDPLGADTEEAVRGKLAM